MPHPLISAEEASRLGEDFYEGSIRVQVKDAFDGKIVVIDVETGDYEVGNTTLEGADKLLAKRPDATLYSLRVGYDAVYSFGGSTIRRTSR